MKSVACQPCMQDLIFYTVCSKNSTNHDLLWNRTAHLLELYIVNIDDERRTRICGQPTSAPPGSRTAQGLQGRDLRADMWRCGAGDWRRMVSRLRKRSVRTPEEGVISSTHNRRFLFLTQLNLQSVCGIHILYFLEAILYFLVPNFLLGSFITSLGRLFTWPRPIRSAYLVSIAML